MKRKIIDIDTPISHLRKNSSKKYYQSTESGGNIINTRNEGASSVKLGTVTREKQLFIARKSRHYRGNSKRRYGTVNCMWYFKCSCTVWCNFLFTNNVFFSCNVTILLAWQLWNESFGHHHFQVLQEYVLESLLQDGEVSLLVHSKQDKMIERKTLVITFIVSMTWYRKYNMCRWNEKNRGVLVNEKFKS